MSLALPKDPFNCQTLDRSVQNGFQFLGGQLFNHICQDVLVHWFLFVSTTTSTHRPDVLREKPSCNCRVLYPINFSKATSRKSVFPIQFIPDKPNNTFIS